MDLGPDPFHSPGSRDPGATHLPLLDIRGGWGGCWVRWRSGAFEIPYKKRAAVEVVWRANRCTERDTTRKFGGYMEGWMLSTTCSRGVRGITKRLGWWV